MMSFFKNTKKEEPIRNQGPRSKNQKAPGSKIKARHGPRFFSQKNGKQSIC